MKARPDSNVGNELTHFFYNTNDLCCIANVQGFFEVTNPRFEIVLGYNNQELLENPFLNLVHPDDVSSTLQEIEKLSQGAPTINFVNRYRKKDGDYVWLEWNATPDSATGKLYAVARDISDRKKADERFRLLVESSPYAILLVSEVGEIVLVNNQASALFGYTRQEFIGKRVEELIPADMRHNHVAHREAYAKEQTTRAMGTGRDLFALKKSGVSFPVEIGLNPVETTEGKLTIATVIDISERKEQERILRTKQMELEVKNKELEQFAYIASHDLQEPLRTVTNYLLLLNRKWSQKLEPEDLTYINAMEGALGRMKMLVKQLLDYSRLGRDRKLQMVDFKNLASQTVNDLETFIHSSGAKVEISELPTLPGYEVELRQLLQNLISNAIKFQRKGAQPIIEISAIEEESEWRFSVKDNGIGIDPKHFDKIFKIFQRLHAQDTYEGSGIGLANCKKIVELHHGRIWVESTLGLGTTFCFTIPKFFI